MLEVCEEDVVQAERLPEASRLVESWLANSPSEVHTAVALKFRRAIDMALANGTLLEIHMGLTLGGVPDPITNDPGFDAFVEQYTSAFADRSESYLGDADE